ncbi:MAG TPA: hypothetical protein VNZ68_08690 [Rhodocyclaceae bacterium]|nr:hypothetical protein [Rhodocyclaceae bacterium]
MNHLTSLHSRHHDRHWRKDLQFAAGVMVAVGGAVVLLLEALHLFA